ncbi:hypothetical protein ABID99_005628 [Mucilaginibacter sp. OAE612]|uniref:hypothetical protein n=1 Tax=Mucilaginibacter sp. OAE612 TaxID=3156444 RepID=UPI00359E109B
MFKENQLPELSHWFAYFLNKVDIYRPDVRNFSREEIDFWDKWVSEIKTYQALDDTFGDAFIGDLYPDFDYSQENSQAALNNLKYNYKLKNGSLSYYREVEKTLVLYGKYRFEDIQDGKREALSYDYNDLSNDESWSHYNDDLDMDQQSPDFWDQF